MVNKTDTVSASVGNQRVSVFSDSRPVIITALCGYCFISWILSLINLMVLAVTLSQSSSASFSPSFSTTSVPGFVISLAAIIAVFGYWGMKKWGVYLYTISEVALVVYLLANSHGFNETVAFSLIIGLLLPIVVIYTGFKYLAYMS